MAASSLATASPTSAVPALPPMSFVRTPASMHFLTAASTLLARSGRWKEYFSIMLTDKIVATGFTMPWPEMSGAEPRVGLLVSWAETASIGG